ncbi:protein of unknown function [Flavobacterium anhuiense]|uniref:Shedu protein SduA C-terminal domain-containing protein n=1 Tax=Flavobacterium anhuiense TaxID=459526 RepID=A0ABY0LGZ8_9FLAO|nr:Shedu immune nuclease family protein [Flavobacterium anhuiense]SCY16303.1 protein of unknown function [Flavobacterium anhuiense]
MANNFESNEFEYFSGKVPDKTYVSKRIESKSPQIVDGKIIDKIIPIRYASKVLDCENTFEFIKEKGEVKLRVTSEGRQEITAKFLEDSRGIFILQIQKFTTSTGIPHKTYFSFRGSEIKTLIDFIKSIKDLQIEDKNGFKITDNELKKLILTKEQAFSIYKDNQVIFKEILRENISQEDILNLVFKKEQLVYFDNLLNNESFFEEEKVRLNITKDEALWQNFFELNTWIFGFGLQYVINIPLEAKKLEQVVQGYDAINRGKRADAMMKSKGIINSLCFAEIKTHKTKLLNSAYRPSVFPPSNELSGGVAQVQKTIQSSVENLINKINPTDNDGNPTGEEIFLYRPKSFLLVGTLNEFLSEHGINKEKYSSFELYRRSIKDIEIITFDELLERAKFIVNSHE